MHCFKETYLTTLVQIKYHGDFFFKSMLQTSRQQNILLWSYKKSQILTENIAKYQYEYQ